MSRTKTRNLPSKYVEVRKTEFEKDLIATFAESAGVSEKEADTLLKEQAWWDEIMEKKRKSLTIKMLNELWPKYYDAAVEKIERGSMEQAKACVVAMGIMMRDSFGTKATKGGSLNIAGKNVQINLKGWSFKPYKAKK